MIRFSYLLGVVFSLCSGAALTSAPGSQAVDSQAIASRALDRVVAVINDSIVTESQLTQQMRLAHEAQPETSENPPHDSNVIRRIVLNRMIDIELQRQKAELLGITVSEAELDQVIQLIAKENQLSIEELRQKVEKLGMTWNHYRQQLYQDRRVSKLQREVIAPQITINDQDIQQAQLPFSEQHVSPHSMQYHIEYLQIPITPNAAWNIIKANRKRADIALKQAQAGASFSGLVAASETNGEIAPWKTRDLGWRSLKALPDAFSHALQTLKPGKIAGPVRVPNGFFLIRLVATRKEPSVTQPIGQMIRARHILLKTSPLLDDETIQKRLSMIREHCLSPESFAQQAQEHSEDPVSVDQGGDIGWVLPDTLDPEFEAQIKQLSPGQTSLPFKTHFGWHIAQLIAHKPFTAEDPEWQRQQMIREIGQKKIATAQEQWLHDLRTQAYIRILDTESLPDESA